MKILLMPSSFKCFEFNLPYQMATSFYEFPNKFAAFFLCMHWNIKTQSHAQTYTLARAHTSSFLRCQSSFVLRFIFSVVLSHLFVCKNLCMLVSLPLFHFTFGLFFFSFVSYFNVFLDLMSLMLHETSTMKMN